MSSHLLSFGADCRMPLEAVTQTFAVLGKRGSGKTTTATVLVEELLDAGQCVVVVDPLDVTWGLRSSRDGASAGYPITVLGGDHADLPLEASAGAVIAEFVVEQRASVILSLRQFSLGDQRRFMTDFCERLYALKGKQEHRAALHLVIDEVDEFAHQRIPSGHERLFGAIDRLVRRGRAAGVGVTMISQRPAVIHKDILSQAEVLICHQTISPQDRKALEAWIESHDAHNQRADFLGSLSSLHRGEAWVWSPGWLNVFQRVQIRDRRTFDSSATPKAGEVPVGPEEVAPVDLQALEQRMAATIARAKADDPADLRRQLVARDARIRELEADLASRVSGAVVHGEGPDIEQVFDRLDQAIKAYGQQVDRITAFEADVRHAALEAMAEAHAALGRLRISEAQSQFAAALTRADADVVFEASRPLLQERPGARCEWTERDGGYCTGCMGMLYGAFRDLCPACGQLTTLVGTASSPAPPPPARATSNVALPVGERAVLTAALQFPGLDRKRLTILAGYKKSSRDAYIARLAAKGYLRVDGAAIHATDDGRRALGSGFTPLPTGRKLREYWSGRLPEGERRLLDILIRDHGQRPAKRSSLDVDGGYKKSSRDAYLMRLKARGLVEFPGTGLVRASLDLF